MNNNQLYWNVLPAKVDAAVRLVIMPKIIQSGAVCILAGAQTHSAPMHTGAASSNILWGSWSPLLASSDPKPKLKRGGPGHRRGVQLYSTHNTSSCTTPDLFLSDMSHIKVLKPCKYLKVGQLYPPHIPTRRICCNQEVVCGSDWQWWSCVSKLSSLVSAKMFMTRWLLGTPHLDNCTFTII